MNLPKPTGYHRTYARWLLNHREQVLQTVVRHPRQSRYGPEVVDALVQAWNANNRTCTKCLIPFLPTLLDSLERHGYLHLTPECKTQLLSLSAATADRLLRASRTQTVHGISTTRAGTLLKQQISIRTFEQWNETQPGFVEADLVAHCGVDRGAGFAGGFLCTLTMTDVATGWTECLPLLYQSQETVLTAIERARGLFPFPLLGIDTDNGAEFINTLMVTYCEHEHLTFTRGRPRVKNDHCFVEEKNRTIVRQVVGYDRFVGGYLIMRGVRIWALVDCRKIVHLREPEHQARLIYFSHRSPTTHVGNRQIERKGKLSCSSSLMNIACGQACAV